VSTCLSPGATVELAAKPLATEAADPQRGEDGLEAEAAQLRQGRKWEEDP